MRDAGAGTSRVALDSIQKVGARKNARDAGANPIVETAAALPRVLVKRKRRLDVVRRYRTPIGAARKTGEDLHRTDVLIWRSTGSGFGRNAAGACAGMTDKEPLPAGPFAQAAHTVRAVDGYGSQFRQARHHVDFLAVAPGRLPHVLQLGRTLFPRKANFMRTGGDPHASRHPFVYHGLSRSQVLGLHCVISGTANRS